MYQPTQQLLAGIRTLFPLELLPWDDYYMRMAQTDFFCGRHNLKASKTFFIRKAPFGGSYALLGGLTAFLRTWHDFTVTQDICYALLDMGYKKDFVDYLNESRGIFDLTVYSIPEGGVFFPNEPAIILEGNLLSVRIAEGMLLKNVNFPTLSLTKWSRVVQAAAPGQVMEFARRRAQDDLRTSLYAHLAGATISSNAEIRRGFDIAIRGTMGHEFVQSFGDEFEAFDKWLEINPDRPVLLVDTVDTLNSGVPNAIKAFKKHRDRIRDAKGIPGVRNDSGDLAYITLEERARFDREGLDDVIIYETNDLDEYSIENIREQLFTHAPRAGIDPIKMISKIVWACGTQPGTCSDQPSLGGVAKLSTVEFQGKECPVIKLARDNPIKTSIPGSNRSVWVRKEISDIGYQGELICCMIHRRDEDPKQSRKACHIDDGSKSTLLQFEKNLEYLPRQICVYKNGTILIDPSISDVRNQSKKDLESLHWTHKRFKNPHTVKVSLTEDLFQLRANMILNGKIIHS